MTAHGRLVPHRPVLRAARLHVGTVVTERLDQVRDERPAPLMAWMARAFGVAMGRIGCCCIDP
jgi:hypothetical protein